MQFDETFFDRFCLNLLDMFGRHCEIVVHDFTKGYEHTIVKIYNSLTNRKVGDSPTNKFFEALKWDEKKIEDIPIYFSQTKDGRIFKSFTTFFRNEKDEVIGAVCINVDITPLERVKEIVNSYTRSDSVTEFDTHNSAIFVHSLGELMDYYLHMVEEKAGKPASEMDKNEKLRALEFLDKKGVLHMSKASVKLCDFFGFSKFTFYNYLEEIRKNNGDDE